ncbi:bifunctional (p)ppGpp synthetase/guanosine-3',5'-bis(diphosphate) 3'-pyrophosphohydrolase [Microbacterium foliorum]|uniref:Bifunctional (P)ppGpp synthase/hydrolase relA n=1 Tax=Microbacterium foliorum TaxID=104336 RepID=A0A0F0KBR6_9MICO|nr:bifunctional (p)ppGpp synthetase/guanosine-3',5'-bis(diphosphate) 3'-pyrophosphohydrolase [Microbacterium foliorum]AXL12187.1 bifunctional (p)ppGpp synthetase/guanosine-3',5'-bis(diphosphate) 3'-pyrophosphohydrolase [Microbacterium foliorum]KJL17630.1 Bifunctional (p)ppGpp synthase/hydrolase relA [Microbacterium foliorum]CAH0141891.1 Bifunctional (p)ppGpp synthase/hydrolase RelA [Microbacterium foliorum]CAH0160157.1 Bifunctional (p)ppGpp synthase/hydrolase RelA [Microbacterium foliorum]
MAEPQTSSQGSSLRRLVPRIFSRAPRVNDLDNLTRTVRANHPKGDLAVIERAYAVAKEKHTGQQRQSGEPYITHPLAVAQILAEMGLGPRAIAAALLHDTVEDTGYALTDLTAEFGDEVAMLVDGVTKLDKVKYGESAQAETVRKMIVAMSKDIRVLLIKLADRLHNARTWGFVPPEKAAKKAKETLEIYAPLANRLGIQAIKSELEDLSFAVLHPKIYNEIHNLIAQRTPQREKYLAQVVEEIDVDLRDLRIRGKVVGRPKQLYSVYQKMVVRGREFDDIYDLIGIRVLVASVRDCYAVLGAIHARWTPLPGRFKDYIATPKFNLYQSLHTTVIGPSGRTVEIQIRTHEMHQQAEYGVAAHWMYKERMNGGKTEVRAADNDMAWLAHISDWQAETADPGEFLDSLRFEIGAKEVYVFTPKGRVIGLPAGATPVDFAYAVHTEIGHRTMGSKVNGRLVPLESELKSGDVVEVFTSKNPDAGPSQDWLGFVKSTRARNKIRGWFTKERREEAIEQGKEAIARAMRRQNMPLQRLMSQDSFAEVAHQLRYEDVSALYAAVGEGHVSTQSVLEKVTALVAATDPVTGPIDLPGSMPSREPRSGDSGVLVRGASDILVKVAKCCTPVPGDEIVGFVTRGSGVSVHRTDCPNVKALSGEEDRFVEVSWAPTTKSVFRVQIQVEALDRSGLLSDVTRVLSEHHVNILSATVSTTDERLAISRFVFEMGDAVHLDRILNAVRRIDAVYDVYRVTSS